MADDVTKDAPLNADPVYDRGYHAVRHKHLIENDEYFHARAEAAAKLYFRHFPRPLGSIIEYGCGIGQNISALPGATGFDVSSEALDVCEARGLHVFRQYKDIPQRSWDYVLCRHALEHVEHPLDVLREMFALLKDRGTLILILPKERHRFIDPKPDLNQHLYCWNFRTIDNLIHRAGGVVTKNFYESVVGYRALLPVRRIFGSTAYYHATRAAGRLARVTELVVWAQPAR